MLCYAMLCYAMQPRVSIVSAQMFFHEYKQIVCLTRVYERRFMALDGVNGAGPSASSTCDSVSEPGSRTIKKVVEFFEFKNI